MPNPYLRVLGPEDGEWYEIWDADTDEKRYEFSDLKDAKTKLKSLKEANDDLDNSGNDPLLDSAGN